MKTGQVSCTDNSIITSTISNCFVCWTDPSLWTNYPLWYQQLLKSFILQACEIPFRRPFKSFLWPFQCIIRHTLSLFLSLSLTLSLSHSLSLSLTHTHTRSEWGVTSTHSLSPLFLFVKLTLAVAAFVSIESRASWFHWWTNGLFRVYPHLGSFNMTHIGQPFQN